jgi:LPXTG-motif cell wall-anchored protein
VKQRIRALLVVALATVAAMALSVSAAFAQYPPAEDFGVSCSDYEAAGDTVNCGVVGAQPGEQLTATAEYNPVFYTETFNADAEGRASFAFEVPAEAEGSTIIVRVVGAESGAAADEADQVDDADDDGQAGEEVGAGTGTGTGALPMTGGQIATLTATGLGLLALGLLALRRREDARVTA